MNNNDYQTPTHVAKAMMWCANQVLPKTNLRWCEPTAGIGILAEEMPSDTHCYEVNPAYFEKHGATHCRWFLKSFLDVDRVYDVYLSNPPFSKNPQTGKSNCYPFGTWNIW